MSAKHKIMNSEIDIFFSHKRSYCPEIFFIPKDSQAEKTIANLSSPRLAIE